MSELTQKADLMTAFADEMSKIAKVVTPLQPHQQRVVDRIQQEDQPGLVVIHGLGSGKTLTAIAAQDAMGQSADVVVPASLRENYLKEMKKHHKGARPPVHLDSLQNVAAKKITSKAPLMIVDEAHRLRDPSTSSFAAIKGNEAKKRLLMTGSPFYNHPADIAPLVDLAADQKVLPFDREEFTRRYIAEKTVKPGIGQRALNLFRSNENKVRPGTVPILYERNAPELREAFKKWIDYHPGAKSDDFPDVESKDVKVPMSKEQLKVYDTLIDKAPAWVAAKVKRGLPPDKKELAQLNTFLSGARQAGNTTAPFVSGEDKPQETKIQRAFDSLSQNLRNNPRSKAVVYSNFLDAGINPYKRRLDEAKIPYGEFTGEMSHKKRDQLVRDYNAGKIRTLLLSSAGGEGLDLKGTRLMQILDPHWNDEKLKQVEGRGARYKSHSDLPPEERKMLVEHYLSTRPEKLTSKVLNKITGRKPDQSADEYLTQMSKSKRDLINQFAALLPKEQVEKQKTSATKEQTTEESKELANSLKPRAAAFAAYTLPGGLTGANIGRMITRGDPIATGIGAALGLGFGHIIAKANAENMVRAGKAEAKQALRFAAKENTLREQAGKMDYGAIGKSMITRAIGDISFLGYPVVASNIGRVAAGMDPILPEARDMAISGGMAALGNIVGSIGTGYLDKYRKMIAVNELENVRAHMGEQEKEKLRRARATVAKLEDKLEGDGWKKKSKSSKTESEW